MVGQVITPSPLKTIGKVKYIKTQKIWLLFLKKKPCNARQNIFRGTICKPHRAKINTNALYILSNRVRDLLASYCMMEQKYFS